MSSPNTTDSGTFSQSTAVTSVPTTSIVTYSSTSDVWSVVSLGVAPPQTSSAMMFAPPVEVSNTSSNFSPSKRVLAVTSSTTYVSTPDPRSVISSRVAPSRTSSAMTSPPPAEVSSTSSNLNPSKKVMVSRKLLSGGTAICVPRTSSPSSEGSLDEAQAITFTGTGGILPNIQLNNAVRDINYNLMFDPDVEEAVTDYTDDFVDGVFGSGTQFIQHRAIGLQDLQYHLARNRNMWVPGFGTDELQENPRAEQSEAHEEGMTDVNTKRMRRS